MNAWYVSAMAGCALLIFAGCERLNLKPNPTDSDLRVIGTFAGSPIQWDATENELTTGISSDGSWCALHLDSDLGPFEVEFRWHVPSGIEAESEMQALIAEGNWSLESGMGAALIWEGPFLSSDCFFNGMEVTPGMLNLPFILGETNVFSAVLVDGPCSLSSEWQWATTSYCDEPWMTETFAIEYEDDAVDLYAPALGDWLWTVAGGGEYSSEEELVLPLISGDYTVSMRPADPQGEWGDFMVTRTFPGTEVDDCEQEIEFDVEAEGLSYLEIRVTFEGAVFTSEVECGQGATGFFVAHEVEAFEPDGEGRETRLVQFSCDVELHHDSEAIGLVIEEGALAFPIRLH